MPFCFFSEVSYAIIISAFRDREKFKEQRVVPSLRSAFDENLRFGLGSLKKRFKSPLSLSLTINSFYQSAAGKTKWRAMATTHCIEPWLWIPKLCLCVCALHCFRWPSQNITPKPKIQHTLLGNLGGPDPGYEYEYQSKLLQVVSWEEGLKKCCYLKIIDSSCCDHWSQIRIFNWIITRIFYLSTEILIPDQVLIEWK